MRSFRITSVTALVAASLAVPAVAAAAPTVSVASTGQLGPEGATAVIRLTVTCDPGATNPGAFVSIAQTTGNRLLQGGGGNGARSAATRSCATARRSSCRSRSLPTS
jgi:hypothetical protein